MTIQGETKSSLCECGHPAYAHSDDIYECSDCGDCEKYKFKVPVQNEPPLLQGLEELRQHTQASIARLISQRRGSETVDDQDRVTASNIMFVAYRFIKESTKQELTKARLEGAADYIRTVYGERCETKDIDDFPDITEDSRCVICREWEYYDEWANTLTTELNQEKL